MPEQKCNVTLHEKLAARSGRLQLIVADLSCVAQALEQLQRETVPDEKLFNESLGKLLSSTTDFGVRWLDETAMLLKELYNRREGP